MQPCRDDRDHPPQQNEHHRRDNQQTRTTSHPAPPPPAAWEVSYLLQRSGHLGWQRHRSRHEASLDAATKCLHVTDASTSRLQERVDLAGEVEVAFVATARGQSIIRFALVSGHSWRKFALIAASGRDAAELCQALDRQGVAVAGLESLPDAVFLRGGDQQTTQALEARIPSLSRPEVQAYIVRLLFQDSFHQFVGDLSEMFSQVQTHLPVPEPDSAPAAPTPRAPIDTSAGAAAAAAATATATATATRRANVDSSGSFAREGRQAGVVHCRVAGRGAGGAGRGPGRGGDRAAVWFTGGEGKGGGGGGGEGAKGKDTVQAGRGGGRERERPQKRAEGVIASLRGQQEGVGGGVGGGGGGGGRGGASGSTLTGLPCGEKVRGCVGKARVPSRSQTVGEAATGGATASRRTAKEGGAGTVPGAVGAGGDRGRGGVAKPTENDTDKDNGTGNGNGNGNGNTRKKRKKSNAAACSPPAGAAGAAVRAPTAGVPGAACAAGDDAVSESAAEAPAAAAASGAQQHGEPGAPVFLRRITSSGRAPGLLAALKKKWSQVNKHRSAWPFLTAVNLAEAPGYLDVVKHPLDLESIRKRLDGAVLHYTSCEMLHDDLCLMCRNAMAYNDEGTDFYRAAEDLLEFVGSIFAR